MVCFALKLVGSWVALSFSVVWRLLDELLSMNVLWSSQVLDLSLLPLVFSLWFTVTSRLLHPYSTTDKTSRLMDKRFSTVRDPQRGSQSYMVKRRGRMEIEVTRWRRGGIKRGESNLASNQIPMGSPQPGTPREVHGVTLRREEKREEGDRGDQEEKMGNKKGSKQYSQ